MAVSLELFDTNRNVAQVHNACMRRVDTRIAVILNCLEVEQKTKRGCWRTHPARLSGPCKQARMERRWQARHLQGRRQFPMKSHLSHLPCNCAHLPCICAQTTRPPHAAGAFSNPQEFLCRPCRLTAHADKLGCIRQIIGCSSHPARGRPATALRSCSGAGALRLALQLGASGSPIALHLLRTERREGKAN